MYKDKLEKLCIFMNGSEKSYACLGGKRKKQHLQFRLKYVSKFSFSM